jgi:hypothetical protein
LEKLLGVGWSFSWWVALTSIVSCACFGGIGGFIAGFNGHPELASTYGALLGFMFSLPVSVRALRAALLKKRSNYRIMLIKDSE